MVAVSPAGGAPPWRSGSGRTWRSASDRNTPSSWRSWRSSGGR
jgi:hypothetical protein